MSSEDIKTPSRRKLLLVGVIALVIAGVVAVSGIIGRATTNRDLVQWTNQQAVPTVALAQLKKGDQYQSLRLPGTIQAYRKAAIYARVSGYLKSWQLDIGAHVQPGQVLAVIDTPDLDQQLAQANAQLAAVTAQRWDFLVKRQVVSQQTADNATSDATAKKAVADAAQANV